MLKEHLAALVHPATILHQVLGFCSDLHQKLRTAVSFQAPSRAIIIDAVFATQTGKL